MNLHCLECGKPVEQTPGKRAKSYCGIKCRVSYWKKQKQVASGLPKRAPGRPKKDPSDNKKKPPRIFNLRIVTPGLPDSEIKKVAEAAKNYKPADTKEKEQEAPKEAINEFMGHSIPKGLKGVDLAIWKAEIKDKNK